METAPYRADLAEGPERADAYWSTASDGVRIRIVVWPNDTAQDTILIFPGRTEYIEKYGRVARDLIDAGYQAVAVDWRGQGLSERLASDPLLGHIGKFQDYQLDVAACLALLKTKGVVRPRFLLAHSMGGAIGYRALVEGLAVERAMFSAPMWGIHIPPVQRAFANLFTWLARRTGKGHWQTPGSRPIDFESEEGFKGNPLTTDLDHFQYFSRQLKSEPDFRLGAPSLNWLGEAMEECGGLIDLPRPDLPTLTFYGTEETIVSVPQLEAILDGWESGRLVRIEGARHELTMEAPEIRRQVFEAMRAFFGEADV